MPSPNEVNRRPIPNRGEMPEELRQWFQQEGANVLDTLLVDAVAAKVVLAFPGLSFLEAQTYTRDFLGVHSKAA